MMGIIWTLVAIYFTINFFIFVANISYNTMHGIKTKRLDWALALLFGLIIILYEIFKNDKN